MTDDFWEKYTADEPEHSDVHLLPYPIRVEQDGTVGPLDDPNVSSTFHVFFIICLWAKKSASFRFTLVPPKP